MAEKKNEVAEVKEPKMTFSEALTTSLVDVRDALPSDFNTTRFVQNAVALLNENDTLATFAKTYGTGQIKSGLMRGAYLGLDFMNKEAYLIPYKNKLNFMLDYRGARKLCKKYAVNPIDDIYADVVRQGDEISYGVAENGQRYLCFNPKPLNDGAVIGAFAVIIYKDGTMGYEVMSKAQIEKARQCSKMASSMPWTKFYEEMAKKTVLHRVCKAIEIDFENPMQRSIYDEDGKVEDSEVNTEVPDIFDDGETEVVSDVEIVEEGN